MALCRIQFHIQKEYALSTFLFTLNIFCELCKFNCELGKNALVEDSFVSY